MFHKHLGHKVETKVDLDSEATVYVLRYYVVTRGPALKRAKYIYR